MEKEKLVDELLEILSKYFNKKIAISGNFNEKRQLFRGICNQSLSFEGIDKKFYTLQNELLLLEQKEKNLISVDDLVYKNGISHFCGDITTLKADAIVNAANDDFLGCFYPCHNCIDNVIMSASGFQMRNELMGLKKQKDYDMQKVKVTKGYNLPCKFVFHVAGPIVLGKVTKQNEIHLANCYENCLDKAKEMNLKTIVFCCISTGEYHFPNEKACKIATKTVKKWLKNNDFCLKVIFNTFKIVDKELYENELQ